MSERVNKCCCFHSNTELELLFLSSYCESGMVGNSFQFLSYLIFIHKCLTSWELLPSPFSEVKVAQSCSTLCDPMDYLVHGILHARILAFPFSRRSSQPRDQTQVSHIAGGFFAS